MQVYLFRRMFEESKQLKDTRRHVLNNILLYDFIYYGSQMKVGFARLQATWRARKLTRDYRRMRRRIYLFQTRCRGMLKRKEYRKRLRCIIILQTGFRRVLAIRKVKEMREEVNMQLNTLF